ncbi:MAG: BT4734/BF3469 family protein [Bacteroides sp.]
MFGYSTNAKNQQVTPCSAELLDRALRSPQVARVCGEIEDALEKCRRGELTREEFEKVKSKLKIQLPVITPHATFAHGRRKADQAVPSGLSMYDIDHIDNPRGRWQEMAHRAQELGICLAHITPSTEGLRLLFVMPQGMTLEQAQRWMSQQLQDADYDAVCKDFARCSFLVPEDYVLYRNDELLFAEAAGSWHAAEDKNMKICENQSQSASSACHTSEGHAVGAVEFPQEYKGVPYALIVEKLAEQLGGIPEHGSRNNFIYAMACNLRYICDDNVDWVASILPNYGEEVKRWRGTIRSALNRAQSQRPSETLMRALKMASDAAEPSLGSASSSGDVNGTNGCNVNGNATDASTASDEENVLCPPPMPANLPPLIELLTSRTPEEYKPAVAHAVFPSLAAHLYKTTFRYIDNVEHEATLMCLLMAGTGAGKSCVDEPINRIMADIRKRDAENLRREREWKDEVNRKGANKDKKERPKGLVIQEIDTDITNPAFILRTAEAEEHFLYAKLNEVDQFDALRGSGKGGQQFQLMCLAFDPKNRYGQTRVGAQSVTEKVTVRFNWNASTTIVKGQSYFRQVLLNGPISRINFCTIPEREIGAEMPVYGTYDDSFDELLRPYIDRLCGVRGLVACREAEELALQLRQESADHAVQTQSRIYENLSFRANVIAYLKAMVLYVAHGGWDESFTEFIRWSKEYDLYCKMAFWGDMIEEAQLTARKTNRRGPANLLTQLPKEFTREEFAQLLQRMGRSSDPMNTIRVWTHRGYIAELVGKRYTYRKLIG